ncbi:FHA domain-containing protein [Lacisediminihabitans sp.]|uniref:FHA domain-containing protein n=1 Tax=Lacisediminihabitans sp. TaxID=2787631 RepID=UPI00374D8403
MTTGETNPFLIVPPPGLVPAPASEKPAPAVSPAEPDEFISLPPGIVDSATFRIDAQRPSRAVERPTDDIVFFPAAPGFPVATPAPASDPVDEVLPDAPSAGWTLQLPGGTTVAIDSAVFIGRDPSRTPDRPTAELLAVVDPARTVSKTHALLEIDEHGLWAHDLRSTNGVFITEPGGAEVDVPPGSRTRVPAGADLELGDYVIRVQRGA